MSSARSNTLVRKCLYWLALTTSCSPLALAGDTDARVARESGGKSEVVSTAADTQRGRLLYETHCNACHTTQAHWRENHIVQSWADLLYQVTRMEKNAGQDWTAAEITDVAAYLNELFYKLPCPVPGCQGSQAGIDEHRALARRQ